MVCGATGPRVHSPKYEIASTSEHECRKVVYGQLSYLQVRWQPTVSGSRLRNFFSSELIQSLQGSRMVRCYIHYPSSEAL